MKSHGPFHRFANGDAQDGIRGYYFYFAESCDVKVTIFILFEIILCSSPFC